MCTHIAPGHRVTRINFDDQRIKYHALCRHEVGFCSFAFWLIGLSGCIIWCSSEVIFFSHHGGISLIKFSGRFVFNHHLSFRCARWGFFNRFYVALIFGAHFRFRGWNGVRIVIATTGRKQRSGCERHSQCKGDSFRLC